MLFGAGSATLAVPSGHGGLSGGGSISRRSSSSSNVRAGVGNEGNQSFRDAEDLFARLSVAEVKRVLAHTEEEANRKRDDLRSLVGERYHDLLDSADTIVGMDDAVQTVNSLTEEVKKLTEVVAAEAKRVLAKTSGVRTPSPADDGSDANITSRGPRVARALMKIVCPLWRHVASQDLYSAAVAFAEACALRSCAEGVSPFAKCSGKSPNALMNSAAEEGSRKLEGAIASGIDDGVAGRLQSMRSRAAERSMQVRQMGIDDPYGGGGHCAALFWNMIAECEDRMRMEIGRTLRDADLSTGYYCGALYAHICLLAKEPTCKYSAKEYLFDSVLLLMRNRNAWLDVALEAAGKKVEVDAERGEPELALMLTLRRTIEDAYLIFIRGDSSGKIANDPMLLGMLRRDGDARRHIVAPDLEKALQPFRQRPVVVDDDVAASLAEKATSCLREFVRATKPLVAERLGSALQASSSTIGELAILQEKLQAIEENGAPDGSWSGALDVCFPDRKPGDRPLFDSVLECVLERARAIMLASFMEVKQLVASRILDYSSPEEFFDERKLADDKNKVFGR